MKGGLHKCEMAERFSDKDIFYLSDKLEKEKSRSSHWKEMYEWEKSNHDRSHNRFIEEQKIRLQNLKERDYWKLLAELFMLGFIAICCIFIFYALNCN